MLRCVDQVNAHTCISVHGIKIGPSAFPDNSAFRHLCKTYWAQLANQWYLLLFSCFFPFGKNSAVKGGKIPNLPLKNNPQLACCLYPIYEGLFIAELCIRSTFASQILPPNPLSHAFLQPPKAGHYLHMRLTWTRLHGCIHICRLSSKETDTLSVLSLINNLTDGYLLK